MCGSGVESDIDGLKMSLVSTPEPFGLVPLQLAIKDGSLEGAHEHTGIFRLVGDRWGAGSAGGRRFTPGSTTGSTTDRSHRIALGPLTDSGYDEHVSPGLHRGYEFRCGVFHLGTVQAVKTYGYSIR